MKALLQTCFGVILILFFSACQNNVQNTDPDYGLTEENSILLKDKFGEQRIPKSPKKVVIFDMGVIDIFDEFGLEENIVGIPKQTVPHYLNSFFKDENIIHTGSLIEPNFDKVNEADPDLIIMSGRQENHRDEFRKIAPTLFIDLDFEDYINSVQHNIDQIGKLYDIQNIAKAINEDLKTTINSSKYTNPEKKALFLLYNNGKFSAYGPQTRFGFVYDEFGFTPVDKSLKVSLHGQSVSSEYIQEHNPDILLVLDRNAAIGNVTVDSSGIENKLVQQTQAYKDSNIVYLSPQTWYLATGGSQALKKMAGQVERVL